MGGYKEVDSLNKEFQKAQKNWNKMNMKVDQQQQQYYRVCQECIQNDSRAKQDEKNIEKDRYDNVLGEIKDAAPQYIGDMKRIHQKSQNIENRKIQFFQEILTEYTSIVDYAKMQNVFNGMSETGRKAIDNINASKDLENWNSKINLNLDCPIPGFVEYDPSVPIQRGKSVKRDSVKTTNGSISSNSSVERTDVRTIYGDNTTCRVRALYDYQVQDDDEIPLKKGEILEELKPEDDHGWSVGRLSDGTEGVYPAKYVEKI